MYRSNTRNRRFYERPRRTPKFLVAVIVLAISVLTIVLMRGQPASNLDHAQATPDSLLRVQLPGQVALRSHTINGRTERLPFEPDVPDRTASDDGIQDTYKSGDWVNLTVAPGDNLSLIFSRLTLSKRDLHDIVSLGKNTARLKRINPGQVVRFRVIDGRLEEMVLELDQLNSLHVMRDGSSFSAFTETIEPKIKMAAATTEITQSLFVDGQKAGLSDALIMHLTEIFGWDIDFALDLREHDRFSVIYEEIYKDNELIKQDRILAAEFVNRGKRLRAILYIDDRGQSDYFSDTGEAMRKAFLRTPVNFTRISSRFNLRRKHPILNTIRAHRGVDYAAPSGTPVRATAEGRVKFIGRDGGYGKTIVMQHGEVYSTLYAHLSRYARGIKRGKYLNQGKIIGYVGKSGLATGPHLHYEFRIHGVHRNPLTVDLPKAEPIDRNYLQEFKRQAKPLLAQLDILLAQQAPPDSSYVAQLNALELPAPTNLDDRN